jgi:hypothetical protein
MVKKLINLFNILILALLLINYVVKCNESDGEDHESENIESESFNNYNTTDGEDNHEIDYEEEEEDNQSFIDKIKRIHQNGKNVTLSKNVKNIDSTFEILKNIQKVFGSLFKFDQRERLKLIEFLSEIDLNLSPKCMSDIVRITSGITETDLWAIKCKFNSNI